MTKAERHLLLMVARIVYNAITGRTLKRSDKILNRAITAVQLEVRVKLGKKNGSSKTRRSSV